MNSLPLRLSRCSVDIGCRASQVRMTSPTRRSARRIPTSIKLNRPVDPRLFFLLTALFTQTFPLGISLVHSKHIPANNALSTRSTVLQPEVHVMVPANIFAEQT